MTLKIGSIIILRLVLTVAVGKNPCKKLCVAYCQLLSFKKLQREVTENEILIDTFDCNSVLLF